MKVVSTCSLVYVIHLTMKMQSTLQIKLLMSAIYHQSPLNAYDDSLFLFHSLPATMFHHSVWSGIIIDTQCSEA